MTNEYYLFTHQGWTDIFNCLPLINYYSSKYELIYFIVRDDAQEFVNFYIKNLANVKPIYCSKSKVIDSVDIKKYLKDVHNLYTGKFLFHGCHDIYRTDEFHKAFNQDTYDFFEGFYVIYNIPYSVRIDFFNFERDKNIEEDRYINFINKYGEKYILHHEIHDKTSYLVDNSIPYINLNNISQTFFDFIKIIENSVELHLIDSVWATLIYMIDAKYKLFSNKKIYVYCKRSHHQMFLKPITLNNWILI
jgi:chloramphenicol O-acetyltransferase